jgi:hypothetical protein
MLLKPPKEQVTVRYRTQKEDNKNKIGLYGDTLKSRRKV